MSGGLQIFYTPEAIARVETAISSERLAPYMLACGGDKLAAILLYERNTSLSEALYGVIQGLEVALRNSFHQTLAKGLGTPEWYDVIAMQYPEQKSVARAKELIERQQRVVAPGKVVAELNFGFWTALTQSCYAKPLWDPHLHKAFPAKRMGNKAAHQRLEIIRRLRNRVAHHERIIQRDLAVDYTLLIETIGWICPVTAEWVRRTNCFEQRFHTEAAGGYEVEKAPSSEKAGQKE
ncbi:MAG: hypothetical protein ACRD3O_03055 [Terriglobia bacterium]